MKRREDIYNLGNDYFQKAEKYFRTTSAEVEAVSGKSPVYSDGIYHYTQVPVYELSGGVSALNKRIFNVPQTEWDPATFDGIETFSAINDASAVFSPEYATGVVVGPEEPFANWDKTPKAKKD